MVASHPPTLTDRVDREVALEILKEVSRLATSEELVDLGRRLERKASLFRETFRQDRFGTLGEAELDTMLCHIFSVRTRRKRLLREVGNETLRQSFFSTESILLYAWSTRHKRRVIYGHMLRNRPHVRLRSPREVRGWLEAFDIPTAAGPEASGT